MNSVEFLLGLLDQNGTAYVAAEDLDGLHGDAIRIWQGLGFIEHQPAVNPVASCPHCGGGTPYRLEDRYLCNACRSTIDPHHLRVWPLHRDAVFQALALHLQLHGGVRRIDEHLWQLGTGESDGMSIECFYRGDGPLAESGKKKLDTYRRLVVLHGPRVSAGISQPGRSVPLSDVFSIDGSLAATDVPSLLRPRGMVRFDGHSGALWLGDTWLGEVPPGSKEFYLLECLAEQLDHYVPYRDLKKEVLRRSGSADETDEATFCHGLKRRIKKHGVAEFDRLLVTTNKADGYRLRGYVSKPCQI